MLMMIVGLLFVLVLGGVAAGAGVGGGALYIPLFVVLFTEDKLAIPLSKACAFGAAVALFVVNSPRTRPSSVGGGTRPIIEYSVALLLEPLTLVGTIIGVRLNKALPFVVLATTMTVVMVLIAFKTLHRALRLRAIENAIRTKDLDEVSVASSPSVSKAEGSTYLESPLLPVADTSTSNDQGDHGCDEEGAAGEGGATEVEAAIDAVIKYESNQYPIWSILGMVGCWAVSMLPSVLVSGSSGLHVACLSSEYFALMGGSAGLLVCFAAINAYKEIRFQSVKTLSGVVSDDDLLWSPGRVSGLAGISLVAGAFSAMVGVGGSTIKGPFLAHLFSDARVSTATSAYMLLSTCSSSMVQFMLLDMLPLKMAFVYFLAGFCAAFFGARFWNAYVGRHKRRSMLVFLLGGYIAIASAVMCALSIYQYSQGAISHIKSAC